MCKQWKAGPLHTQESLGMRLDICIHAHGKSAQSKPSKRWTANSGWFALIHVVYAMYMYKDIWYFYNRRLLTIIFQLGEHDFLCLSLCLSVCLLTHIFSDVIHMYMCVISLLCTIVPYTRWVFNRFCILVLSFQRRKYLLTYCGLACTCPIAICIYIPVHISVGPLSSVDLKIVHNNATSLTVSWSAPFSLDVTGVDPDIWYSVLIYMYNGTDEENPTAIPCTDCTNLTVTHYTFSPDNPIPCHTYTFTVIPYNGAGQGESSHNATATIGSEFRSCICCVNKSCFPFCSRRM